MTLTNAGVEDEKLFEIDGVLVKVYTAASEDSRYVEYSLEGERPLDNLLVAKVLEVLGSKLMQGLRVSPAIYAKELN